MENLIRRKVCRIIEKPFQEYQLTKQAFKLSLGKLIDNIRTAIFNKRAELSIFVKAIAKSGISLNNAGSYDNYKWCPVSIMLYKADNADFPKITSASLQSGISKIKYSLNTTVVDEIMKWLLQIKSKKK